MTKTRFGRYELHQPILSNSVVTAYSATARLHPGFDKPCMVQVVSEKVAAEKGFAEGLRREAALALRMTHPNVVSVEDIIKNGGRWLIACEGVDGCDLHRFASGWCEDIQQPPPLEAVLYIAREVLTGLDYCHRMARQVYGNLKHVHREITSANVLLSREGAVKLANFGLGISPGQLRKPRSTRTDLFRVGALLFELLSGKIATPDADFAGLAARLPKRVGTIIARATARDDRRYQSIVEFRNHVQRTLGELGPRFSNWELANLVRGQLDGSAKDRQSLALSLKPTVLTGGADRTIENERPPALFDDDELTTQPVATKLASIGALSDTPTAEETPRRRATKTTSKPAEVVDLRRRQQAG